MIFADKFCKIYDQTLAVERLSFSVNPGDVLGFVGRNGAGKTTTLRSLAGIIPISDGFLTIGGFDVARQSIPAKQITAYVPDDPQLFHDLTVEQHLHFTARVYGIAEPRSHADQLLTEFELETKRRTPASDLSRGMRQKLAICCAYLSQPKALLLDEPMTGLDPQAIRVLKQSILAAAENGMAVIISSHLLAMVEDICSHVLILDRGSSKFFGTVQSLRDQHRSSDVVPSNESSLEKAYFAAISG